MLRSIRDNIKGRAAKVVLAIMIIPFVFFGIGSLVDSGGAGSVLEINGEEVDQSSYLLEMQIVRNELITRMGEDIDYTQLNEANLAPLALDRLTRRTLISQTIDNMDMSVPSTMVDSIITSTPNFQVDGQFSNELLTQFLANQRINLSMLKSRVASDIQERQLAAGVALSNFSMPFYNDLMMDIFNETREVSWVKLPLVDVTNGIEVSDTEIESYYQANLDNYKSELQVSLEYIELRREDLYEPVSDEQVEAEYRSQQEQFQATENRRVAHILLEISDDQNKAQALEKLATISARLVAGESFASLASEFSQDGGSAADGGQLGYAQQDGTYPKPFEDAIFSLALNEISEPVETDAGLHLIKVTEIDSVEIESIDELRRTITEQLQIRSAQARYVGVIEQAADIAFNAADLGEPAKILELEVKSTPPIGRSGLSASTLSDGSVDVALLSDKRILTAAFSDEVIADGTNSEVIELSPEHAVIVRAKEVFEPRQYTLDEVKADISPLVVREKAADKLALLEQSIKTDVSGADQAQKLNLTDAAQKAGYSASSQTFSRRSTEVDREFLLAVFEAPRSSIEAGSLQSISNIAGDIYLYQLIKVDVDDTASNDDVKKLFNQQLQGMAGQQDIATFFESVESKADIQRNLR
jgi:peptidyl-prolyl cis-trans isomerase D